MINRQIANRIGSCPDVRIVRPIILARRPPLARAAVMTAAAAPAAKTSMISACKGARSLANTNARVIVTGAACRLPPRQVSLGYMAAQSASIAQHRQQSADA